MPKRLPAPNPSPQPHPPSSFVLSSNRNTRPRPAEVLVNGAEAELIRERETVEGLMAGEKLYREAQFAIVCDSYRDNPT